MYLIFDRFVISHAHKIVIDIVLFCGFDGFSWYKYEMCLMKSDIMQEILFRSSSSGSIAEFHFESHYGIKIQENNNE